MIFLIAVALAAQTALSSEPAVSSIISALPPRNVGFGSVMGPRFSALAVYENDPKIFYVGSANGGVVKTTDGGEHFSFVFDQGGSSNIGALAISQNNPDLVWVGTGEPWQRNTIGRGDGVYKSTDGGKSWTHMGLKDTNTIAKIVIDPKNNDVVFAAAMGNAWGYGPERGIYKTKDSGKTWKKVLYADERSSGVDVIIDPKNPNKMLAALWDHIHRPYGWFESGPGSAIYRSTDAGETWQKVTQGLPTEKVGRIAIDYFPKDPRYVAAVIQQPKGQSWSYRSTNGGATWQKMAGKHVDDKGKALEDRGVGFWSRPYYNHFIRYDQFDKNKVYYAHPKHYTGDGGDTWHGDNYDEHVLWLDPKNPKHCMWGGDDWFYESWHLGEGKGEPEKKELKFPILSQPYCIGYDMRKLYWIMGTLQDCWGRMSPTQTKWGAIGDSDYMQTSGDECGYTMADPNDWTKIYSSMRGLFMTKMDLVIGSEKELTNMTGNNYLEAFYNKSQSEKYLKSNPKFRANWNSHWSFSPWDSHTLYFGANYLFRSTDSGEHWEIISPDLTHDKPEWQMPDDGEDYHGDSSESRQYQSIRCVYESPVQKNLIWVGTDDGYVQLTKDGGKNWENVTGNISGLPEYSWISSVHPSRFVAGRAYITADNHRNNDFKTYIYVTEDFGKSWTKITGTMPAEECCYVIKEGMKNPDLLYLGTEKGVCVSLDRGKNWDRYTGKQASQKNPNRNYFPTVGVFDLQVHPREMDLLIAAHGRGAWIVQAKALEEMTAENRAKDVYFATPGNVYLFPYAEKQRGYYDGRGGGNTQPGTLFCYYLKQDAKGEAKIKITDQAGRELGIARPGEKKVEEVKITGPAKAGLNSVAWMNRVWQDASVIWRPGDYRVVLTIDGKEYIQNLHVEDATEEVLGGVKRTEYPENRIYTGEKVNPNEAKPPRGHHSDSGHDDEEEEQDH